MALCATAPRAQQTSEPVGSQSNAGGNFGGDEGTGADASSPRLFTGNMDAAQFEDLDQIPDGDRSQSEPVLADSVEWERVAERAERVIEAGRASNTTLEELRADLVLWRTRFREAQSANATRIETVKAQIAALGPPPAEGVAEAAEIALRRRQLEDTLTRLGAPRLAAEEAWSRADSLIRSIDTLIRERSASELLRLGPSPLNPATWPLAWRELRASLASLGRESAAAWGDEARRGQLRDRMPAIVGLALLTAFTLLYLPRLMRRGTERLARRRGGRLTGLVEPLGSLARVLSLAAGVLALRQGVMLSGLSGYRGSILIEAVAWLALLLLGTGWLAQRTFVAQPAEDVPAAANPLTGPLPGLSPRRQTEGRVLAVLLAATLWGVVLVRRLTQLEGWSEASHALWQFPMLLLAGLSLARLGMILGRQPKAQPGARSTEFRSALLRLLGRTLAFLGIAGAALAAIGYQGAATFLILPAALTLGLLAALVQLHLLLTRLYGLTTGRAEVDLAESLGPVLLAILLGLAALPVLALIWGARPADLSELWGQLRAGLPLGDTRISPGMLLTLLVTFLVGYGLTRLLQGTLRDAVLPKTRLDEGAQSAIVSGTGYLGILLAALLAVTTTGLSLTSLAVVFGALSVGIGFGLQNVVQNFVAGIIMLVERPVAVGDWVEVGGKQGIVRQISVRSTRIQAWDRTSVIVPNADFISGTVRNWTRGNPQGRVTIPLRVELGSDSRKVEELVRGVAAAHPQVLRAPAPLVYFDGLGPEGLNFTLYAYVPSVNVTDSVGSELRHKLLEALAEEGIELARSRHEVRLDPTPPIAASAALLPGAEPVLPAPAGAPGGPVPG